MRVITFLALGQVDDLLYFVHKVAMTGFPYWVGIVMEKMQPFLGMQEGFLETLLSR